MLAEVLLEIKDLELSFGALKALDCVELGLRKGEITSIIGPNGAGKTSLINCITGYYHPENGSINLNKRNIIGLKPYQIAHKGISRTFQNPTIYPNMTTLDILLAARYPFNNSTLLESMLFIGRSRREELNNRDAVEQVIAFTRIEELRKRPVFAMSYGQRKQVEIARALVAQPSLLLLDEPMSGLDEVMKEIVSELIINMHKTGMTILLIEHDMQTVMELSQTVVVLDYGKKITSGTPSEISRDSRVISAYLGQGSS